jgi:hypothetical protein
LRRLPLRLHAQGILSETLANALLTTCSCSAASAACEWGKATVGNAKSCDRCISIKKKCFFAGPCSLTAGDQGEDTLPMSLQMLKNEIKLGFDRALKENVAVLEMARDLLADLKHAQEDRKQMMRYLQALACARVNGMSKRNAKSGSDELSTQPEEQRSMNENNVRSS